MMKTQFKYTVIYSEGGKQKQADYEAISAGEAFARCLTDHPSCKLLKARSEGSYMGGYGHTDYDPPSVQRLPVKEPRPFRKLKKHEKGCEFPFYDKVKVRPVQGA